MTLMRVFPGVHGAAWFCDASSRKPPADEVICRGSRGAQDTRAAHHRGAGQESRVCCQATAHRDDTRGSDPHPLRPFHSATDSPRRSAPPRQQRCPPASASASAAAAASDPSPRKCRTDAGERSPEGTTPPPTPAVPKQSNVLAPKARQCSASAIPREHRTSGIPGQRSASAIPGRDLGICASTSARGQEWQRAPYVAFWKRPSDGR